MKDLYILDASGFLYRSYYAIPAMTNEKGESTNALYGFIRSYLKLIKDFNPKNCIAVFDGQNGAAARIKIYPEYKAHRTSSPDDLRHQIKWARDFCDLIGLSYLNIQEVEADDTIASIVQKYKEKTNHIYICSSDKDLYQLIDDKTQVLNTHKDNLIIDKKKVEEIFGVTPEQMGDFLAIMGDSSDNIPGLSGFGRKTAAALIKQFHSLEKILAYPEKISSKKKQETIINEKDLALLSKQLVTLNSNLSVPEDEEFYQIKEVNFSKLKSFYQKMSFSSLLKEIDLLQPKTQIEQTLYHLVDTPSELDQLILKLKKQNEICLDTETTAIHPLEAELVGIGFGYKPKEAWYIPLNGQLGKERVINAIKPLLENPSIAFYGQNLKYDLHILENEGIEVQKIAFDTMLASYLLNAHRRQHSLDGLSLEYFGKVKTPISDLIGKGKKQITISDVPTKKAANYCCEDVDYTVRLKELFENELKNRNLLHLLKDLEIPLLKVLTKMERTGIFLDKERLKKTKTPVIQQIQQLENEIYTLAGETFNLNSPKQISQILFHKLKIPAPKKSLSTSADVLNKIQKDHPIAEKILNYRTLEKLRSTYLEILPTQVNPKTNRIHCTFNQTGAATGRLSCQDPNLQNIPNRSEIGKEIREAFRPQMQEYSFLSADYSQVELRILAHLSEDPNLIEAFQNNKDIHSHTASVIYGIPLEVVTKEMRNKAKVVNFGLIYGQQAFGLAQELGLNQSEASTFIKNYFKLYPKVKEFIEFCKKHTREIGKTLTLTGRERPIPEISSPNAQIRGAAERLAVNTPIQGTEADIVKMAMLEVDKIIKKNRLEAKLILQIHDELIFELPDREIEILKPLLKNAMMNVMALKVPLIVDIQVGKNWKEC